MNTEAPKVRVIFRCLSGVLFVGALYGIAVSIWSVLADSSKVASYVFLLGQIWLGILCGYAAFKGRVPNWLVNQK